MKTLRRLLYSAALATSLAGLLAPPAFAADCYAIGEQIAAQNGGTLARASASTQGGRPVCVIVVLVPGRDGERPRRAEFVVPQG